jgi:hypothetical protein
MNNISNAYIMEPSDEDINEPIEFVANADTTWMNSSRRIDDTESETEDELGREFNYEWDEEFFKKYEWLKGKEAEKREKEQDGQSQKLALLQELCKMLEAQLLDIKNEPKLKADPQHNNLYLYFISLENSKMFLHADFKKDYEQVMSECAERFEYVRLNVPRKVVFAMVIHDLYDIDKNVKQFMHMFGIEDTRGGSYTDVNLPDYMINAIEHERDIASLDYFV